MYQAVFNFTDPRAAEVFLDLQLRRGWSGIVVEVPPTPPVTPAKASVFELLEELTDRANARQAELDELRAENDRLEAQIREDEEDAFDFDHLNDHLTAADQEASDLASDIEGVKYTVQNLRYVDVEDIVDEIDSAVDVLNDLLTVAERVQREIEDAQSELRDRV